MKLRRKSIFFAILAIVFNVSGNVLLSRGMRHAALSFELLTSPWILAGIALLVLWLLANLSLLSWADLSYVLPITAGGYALAALIGWAALDEKVSILHWTGIALITIGAILVSRTPPHTTP
jgi:uncharacterized membrane protein